LDWKKNLKYIVAGVGVLAAGVVGAVLISKAQQSSTSPPPGGGGTTQSCSEGQGCPTGYYCNAQGICQQLTSCTTDLQCPTGMSCIGGYCGHRVPARFNTTYTNTTNWSLDEIVGTAGVAPVCYWSSLRFHNYHDFPFTAQVVDSYGNGVPYQTVLITTDYSNLFPGPSGVTVTTDSNGMFSFNFKLLQPDAGGASCPWAASAMQSTGGITSNISLSIPGSSVYDIVPAHIALYITGV